MLSVRLSLAHAQSRLAWRFVAVLLAAVALGSRAAAQTLPLRFTGDGATVIVTQLDEAAGDVAGTLQVPGGSPLPFALSLTVNGDGLQVGRGKVQTDTIARRLSTRENEDGSIRVIYRGNRYVVSLAASGDEVVPPADGASRDSSVARTGGAAASTLGTIRLKKHTFQDKGWGGRPSHTLLVPQDWTVKGGAFWMPPAYFQVMPSQEIEVTSPQGHSLRIEPSMTAKDITPPANLPMPKPKEGTSDRGFPIVYMPQGLEAWRTWMQDKILPATYKDARNIRVTEAKILPNLTKVMVKQYEPFVRMLLQSPSQIGSRRVDCWVLGFTTTYTIGGKAFEEFRMVAVTAFTIDDPYVGRTILWNTDRSFSFRAPVGELEGTMPLFTTIANSLRVEQPWMQMKANLFAKVSGVNRQIAIDNLRAAEKRSAILSKTYREISDIQASTYRSTSSTSGSSQERFVNSIREVDIYTTPGSDTEVELPSGYDHVYVNKNDEYILTNDSLFNPNVDLGVGDWTTMTTTR
ncbi:MAG: hypothetical protein AAGG01_14500 [Planctomycetota bacterium]